jgi:SAM-dependent methyltransferase
MLQQVEILARERGAANVVTRQGDVERLPFGDAEFDLLVTRYSAHHWHNPAAAIKECFRVLARDGLLILSDIVAPEDPLLDTHLQVVELLRDRSHVRDWRVSEWQMILAAAGFESEVVMRWYLDLEFASTLARRVFLGTFMFSSVPARMIQFIRRSPRFCELMQDLFAGTQPYLGLKKRLMKNLNPSLYEIAMSFGFSRIVPGARSV